MQGRDSHAQQQQQMNLRLRGENSCSHYSDKAAEWHSFNGTTVFIQWTHWGLSPGPSACRADVIPLHHVPPWSNKLLNHIKKQTCNRNCELRVHGWNAGRPRSGEGENPKTNLTVLQVKVQIWRKKKAENKNAANPHLEICGYCEKSGVKESGSRENEEKHLQRKICAFYVWKRGAVIILSIKSEASEWLWDFEESVRSKSGICANS